MDDWDAFGNNAIDDDGFPPAPADVFGDNVEDVDVWRNHDSFDGAQEWLDFDGEDDDDLDAEEIDYDDIDPEEFEKDRAPSSSDKKVRASSRNLMSSDRGSQSRDRSNSRDRTRDRSSSRDRSGDRSSSSKGRPSERRRSKSRDRPDEGKNSESHADSKRGRRPKPLKGDPTRQVRRSSISKSDDPFKTSLDENGFPIDDAGGVEDSERRKSGKPRVPISADMARQRRTSGVRSHTDDNLASSYRTSSRRLSSSSRNLGGSSLVRRRDGTVSRLRPSESNQRAALSDERRDAIRGALFGALGEDNGKNEISLSAFLKHDDKPPRKSSDSRSVRSAPAAVHSRDHDRGQKSRRWNKKMAPPVKEDEPVKKEGIKLDIAQLAEAGYIEVHDGKMRLVIDMET